MVEQAHIDELSERLSKIEKTIEDLKVIIEKVNDKATKSTCKTDNLSDITYSDDAKLFNEPKTIKCGTSLVKSVDEPVKRGRPKKIVD